MILPSSPLQGAKPVTGRYEALFTKGGKETFSTLNNRKGVRRCSCSAPVWDVNQNGERNPACAKGVSCFHVAGHLLFILAANGWSIEQVENLIASEEFIGLVYLNVNERMLPRMWSFAKEAVISTRKRNRLKKRKIYNKQGAFKKQYHSQWQFEIRYEIIDRICIVLEEYPGINIRDLEYACTNSGFWKGHFRIYYKFLLENGFITTIPGTNNQKHNFVVCRPEPAKSPEFREQFPWESDYQYQVLSLRHRQRHPQWVKRYGQSLATVQERELHHAKVADMLSYGDEESLTVEYAFMLLHRLGTRQFDYTLAV